MQDSVEQFNKILWTIFIPISNGVGQNIDIMIISRLIGIINVENDIKALSTLKIVDPVFCFTLIFNNHLSNNNKNKSILKFQTILQINFQKY